MTMAFYLIEQSYVGPNADQHPDSHTYRVQTVPGCGNMSKKPVYNGWMGCTNDWDENACGEFASLEDAQAAIEAMTGGEYREDDREDIQEDEVVYRVRVGSLSPMTAAESETWCYESMRDIIAHCTPDDELESWVADCARDAADEGGLLDEAAVIAMAMKYRTELQAGTD
jgi:hypothetical protein